MRRLRVDTAALCKGSPPDGAPLRAQEAGRVARHPWHERIISVAKVAAPISILTSGVLNEDEDIEDVVAYPEFTYRNGCSR
jgi:hypothetical protein